MARNIHMLCAYWGFILMSLHLGLHWNMFLRMLDRKKNLSAGKKKYIFRILAGVIAVYGCYAFIKRQIGSYMFLKMHFVFFDYTEPLVFFMLDYIAVMGLFIAVGYYLTTFLKRNTFQYCLDYFRYFMPMSGNLTLDGSFMDDIVKKSGWSSNDFFIYAMSGTDDFAYSAFAYQLASMLSVTDGNFIEANNEADGNLAFRVQEGGTHTGEYASQYIYNGLCWFWNK